MSDQSKRMNIEQSKRKSQDIEKGRPIPGVDPKDGWQKPPEPPGGLKLHKPRQKQKVEGQDYKDINSQIDFEGFVTVAIQPRFYNPRTGRFDVINGHTFSMRVFSVKTLEEMLKRVEEAV